MRKHRPTKYDLEHVPWVHPNDLPEAIKWTSEWFYGRVRLEYYHDDAIRELGRAVERAVAEHCKDWRSKPRVVTEWLYYDNGRVSQNAVMDPATGAWVKPERGAR